MKRLMIAAPVSGSGKTLLTCGILELFRRHGEKPCAFKCGPDYIDPMFHRVVCGYPGANLDSFFLPEDQVRDLLLDTCRREDAGSAILEGVMGYYDGWELSSDAGSAAALARAEDTGAPAMAIELWAEKRAQLENGEIDADEYENWKASL